MPPLALAVSTAIAADPSLRADEEVRGLSLLDPWASLMPIGEKLIETRSRNATYRGWVAIHASLAFPRHLRQLCEIAPFDAVFAAAGLSPRQLARGAVIALGRLADSFRFDADTASRIRAGTLLFPCARFEADFGDYTPGRWGYVFEHVRPLLTPIPAKGALGLWRLDATLRAALQVAPLGAPPRRAA